MCIDSLLRTPSHLPFFLVIPTLHLSAVHSQNVSLHSRVGHSSQPSIHYQRLSHLPCPYWTAWHYGNAAGSLKDMNSPLIPSACCQQACCSQRRQGLDMPLHEGSSAHAQLAQAPQRSRPQLLLIGLFLLIAIKRPVSLPWAGLDLCGAGCGMSVL